MVKKQKAATLIELIMIILILGIVGVTVTGVIIFFVQLFMYSPRQLDAQKICTELTNTMIEGNREARGMRFTRSIFAVSDAQNKPTAQQFTYAYGYPALTDGKAVRFRWSANRIYQRTSLDGGVTWSAEEVVPYYISPETSIDDKDRSGNGAIFSYRKADDTVWDPNTETDVSLIRRVIISLSVRTNAGAFKDFQSLADIVSSVEIKGF